jgi:hypothetical protein
MRPSELDILGVVDLTTLGYALRLQWEWIAPTHPERLWVPLVSQVERIIQSMFLVSVTVEVGDGTKALFWLDRWLEGLEIESLASNCHTRFLCQNHILIARVPIIIYSTHTNIKYSQIAKCH